MCKFHHIHPDPWLRVPMLKSNRIELNRTHSLRRKHYSYFRGQLRGISTHTVV